jgi:hypothetical protein
MHPMEVKMLANIRILVGSMSIDEALDRAVKAEKHYARIGKMHPEYQITFNKMNSFMKYAELMEKERNWKTRQQFQKK